MTLTLSKSVCMFVCVFHFFFLQLLVEFVVDSFSVLFFSQFVLRHSSHFTTGNMCLCVLSCECRKRRLFPLVFEQFWFFLFFSCVYTSPSSFCVVVIQFSSFFYIFCCSFYSLKFLHCYCLTLVIAEFCLLGC